MTKFCGRSPFGNGKAVPNEMGPPKTKFGGRPAVPAGPLKRFPGAVVAIESGNRRLAKTSHGDGDGSGVRFAGSPNGFKRGRGK